MTDKDILKILADLRHTADKLNLRVVAASKKNAPLTEERDRKLDGVGFQLFNVLMRLEHVAKWYGARKETPEYDYRMEILQATHTAFAKNQITYDEYMDICKALNTFIV